MSHNIVKVVMNWSSGKDAALAFHKIQHTQSCEVSCLLTTISEEHERVFMHGVREELLDMQAARMKLPLLKVKLPASPNDDLYRQSMHERLSALKEQGITAAAYGDIFLEDLRVYRERQLAQIGMDAVFPLWKHDTRDMIAEIGQTGIEAMVVCVSEKYLGKEFLGRKINSDFLNDLPANVDPCGENGEFHTFVYNAPFFSSPIPIETGETVYRSYKTEGSDNAWDTGFYFLDVCAGR